MDGRRYGLATRLISTVLLCSLASCASTTLIQSQPPGARLYLNGEPVGVTPYAMTDTKIVGSTTSVRLELPGYASTVGTISRNEEFDVGACIGGVLLLFPFLWIQGYKPVHTFELLPLMGVPAGPPAPPAGYPAPYYPAPGYYDPYNRPPPPPAPPASAPTAPRAAPPASAPH